MLWRKYKLNGVYTDVAHNAKKDKTNNMKFDFLIPYIQWLVYLLIGFIVLYLRTLITEKAKNRVLSKQNAILTEESESIKSKYNKEIESIRKEYQLDIEKRKYQYESKKEQYLQFFRILDSFSATSNIEMQKKMMPLIDEFNRNYLNAASRNDKKGETNATTVFSKKIQNIMLDANQELIRIKNETSTIRLIASDSILNTLDLLELAYDKSFEASSQMIKDLYAQMLTNDQEGMSKNQSKIQTIANLILNYKNDIITQMRLELNEI